MAMGLNELKLSEWILIDSDYPAQTARKRELLANRHEDVFMALPDSAESGREVLETLASHLTVHFPAWFVMQKGFWII